MPNFSPNRIRVIISPPGEMSKLRQLVLISGAHRTMAVHIKAYERFEKWADHAQVTLYPLEVDKVLKYALFFGQPRVWTFCDPINEGVDQVGGLSASH